MISSGVGFTAKVNDAANKVKSWAGHLCYAVAGVQCFFAGIPPDTYRLSLYNKIDGEDKLTWAKN